MRTYAYLRVSTKDQDFELQQFAITEYCKQNNLIIDRWFEDHAKSGSLSIEKRPALANMLSNLRTNDTIIVYKRDRVSRDLLTMLLIERTVKQAKAQILSVKDEGSEKQDPNSELMRNLFSSFAQYERKLISSRIQDKFKAKRAKNERWGYIPFGKRLSTDNKTIEVCPHESATLHYIDRLHTQKQSLRVIARTLNDQRMFNRNNSHWTHDSVRNVLKRLVSQQ